MIIKKLKRSVALSALDYISDNAIIGIGSGSTIVYFIHELYNFKKNISGVVSSSYYTTMILKQYGIKVFDIQTISCPIIYIDSADQINFSMNMIKGGGGALTNEKIIASLSSQFICIVDESKLVNELGSFPLPIEIIPSSCSYVEYKIKQLGGIPKYRNGFVTDHGNIILDVYNLNLKNPYFIENQLNSIAGIVTVGLFHAHNNDIVLIGTRNGIKIIK